MALVRNLVKTVLEACGYKISRLESKSKAVRSILPPHPLTYHNIDLLLDVGANEGQFALEARKRGYAKKIISIEPLLNSHDKLMSVSESDCNWLVLPRAAVGSSCGEAIINVSENLVSSSLREILASTLDAADHARYIASETVPLLTLDAALEGQMISNSRIYLKIDTQGYEREVLNGAKKLLKDCFAVQLEMSLIPLYEGQATYKELLDFMLSSGFVLWNIIPEFMNLDTGRLLQFDAVFVRG